MASAKTRHKKESDASVCFETPHRFLSQAFVSVQSPTSGQIEAIQVHHLGPGGHKIMQELLLRVYRSIDFSQGPQYGGG